MKKERNKEKTAVIFASRPVAAGMLRYVPKGAFVIGADAGWQRAAVLGLAVDLAVGDFDSASAPPAGQVLRLPAEKDDTDTHFAARWALEEGFGNVVLLGALGGRKDHTHANLQTLLYLAQGGAACLAADETCEIYAFAPGVHRLPAQRGRFLSVFAAGGPAAGVWLAGVRYPLQNATLQPGVPLGTSNEFEAPAAEIRLKEGFLYVMVCADGT